MAAPDTRSALAEWTAAVVVLLGCAAITAGVIAIVLDRTLAPVLAAAGVGVIVVGTAAWVTVVKRRHPDPRHARQEL